MIFVKASTNFVGGGHGGALGHGVGYQGVPQHGGPQYGHGGHNQGFGGGGTFNLFLNY